MSRSPTRAWYSGLIPRRSRTITPRLLTLVPDTDRDKTTQMPRELEAVPRVQRRQHLRVAARAEREAVALEAITEQGVVEELAVCIAQTLRCSIPQRLMAPLDVVDDVSRRAPRTPGASKNSPDDRSGRRWAITSVIRRN